MTLRLPCLRCGDIFDTDSLDPYMPDICQSCFSKGLAVLNGRPHEPLQHARFYRWCARYQKNAANHPTTLALTAALEALESVPHGSLDVDVDGNPNDEDLWASTQCP